MNNQLRTLSFLWLTLLCGGCMAVESPLPIWSEEFDYEGPPNPEIWSYDIGRGNNGWGNSELQTYTSDPDNVKVENGMLKIIGRSNHLGHSFTSARIKTLDQVTVKYGRIEGSIQVPDLSNGLWPAFWMLGNNFPLVGWPSCGELDIMEMGHSEGISKGTVNQRVGSAAHWEDSGSHAQYGQYTERPSNLNTDFHNFTIDWTPSTVTTYVDEALIWTMDITPSSCSDCTEFHHPHFIILNLAIGGHYPGITRGRGITAPFPAEYLIDFIRIYANEWTEMGGTYIPTGPKAVVDCGCGSECTSATLDQNATDAFGSYSCRHRINELMNVSDVNEQEACAAISRDFNTTCGQGCDPTTCSSKAPSPTAPPSGTDIDCGCESKCDSSVLDAVAEDSSGAFSCRDRIKWLINVMDKSEKQACAQVSTEFPSVCGEGCNPNSCNRPVTPAVTNCGCTENCDDSTLDQIATDNSGSISCRDRINWIMSTRGFVEEEACTLVSNKFPEVCGLNCTSAGCNSQRNSTVTDCGCARTCDASILDRDAQDNNGPQTCRERINLVMGTTGLEQESACILVALEFPEICGRGCNPPDCSRDANATLGPSSFPLGGEGNEASQTAALSLSMVGFVSLVLFFVAIA